MADQTRKTVNRKTVDLTLSLSPEVKQRIESDAKRSGMTSSRYVTSLVEGVAPSASDTAVTSALFHPLQSACDAVYCYLEDKQGKVPLFLVRDALEALTERINAVLRDYYSKAGECDGNR